MSWGKFLQMLSLYFIGVNFYSVFGFRKVIVMYFLVKIHKNVSFCDSLLWRFSLSFHSQIVISILFFSYFSTENVNCWCSMCFFLQYSLIWHFPSHLCVSIWNIFKWVFGVFSILIPSMSLWQFFPQSFQIGKMTLKTKTWYSCNISTRRTRH